ncbi:MAG: hypothetical protein MUQ27_03210, partial [Acidimicrobiia bacterium]|nr:hypothetical protein [Acidimicrobiia bacterium]
GRTSWSARLLPTATAAAAAVYTSEELLRWLEEPGVLESLSSGRPSDLQQAANALSGSIAGSPTRGPAEAGDVASAVVAGVTLALTTWLAAILVPTLGGDSLDALGTVGVILVWSYAIGLIVISVPVLVPSIVDVIRGTSHEPRPT